MKKCSKKLFQVARENRDKMLVISVLELLMKYFLSDSKLFLEQTIAQTDSALVLTSIYFQLKESSSKDLDFLRNCLIEKLASIYDLVPEELGFFLDLTLSLISSLDFKVDYFKKFICSSIEDLKSQREYNFAFKNHHVIGMDLSRWDMISIIPSTIGNLDHLRYLSLRGLSIEDLPESFFRLRMLNELDLRSIGFKQMPRGLPSFVKANFADKYEKMGVVISQSIVLALLEILSGKILLKGENEDKIIDWDENTNYQINREGNIIGINIDNEFSEISIIPKEVCLLSSLKELQLPHSRIKHLPNCLFNIQSLEILNLQGNLLSEFPININKFKNLKYLNLEDNNIPERAVQEFDWYRDGASHLDQKQFELAIKECQETLKKFPNHVKAQLHLGIAYKYLGNWKKALSILKKVTELSPKEDLAWSYIADIYKDLGEFQNSINALINALKYVPNNALYWSNLGYLYKKFRKWSEALSAYKKSFLLNPSNTSIIRVLEQLFNEMGDHEKELEMFNLAMDAEFNHIPAKDLREKILKL